ncbi:MAG: hypothetical protein ABIS14_12175 [Sphingomonas sp.]
MRPTSNSLVNSGYLDTSDHLRLQHLQLFGVMGHRAKLIAGMAWGEVQHG